MESSEAGCSTRGNKSTDIRLIIEFALTLFNFDKYMEYLNNYRNQNNYRNNYITKMFKYFVIFKLFIELFWRLT